ncbi:pilus assembly PilX N-terminal domain-containing protein [Candidatus Saccharibacteria bacterium]|nr:pilus assembly PilX N-terminal domain-containing protein [Candidatus Saccharibacteria bacterium]
MSTTRTINKKGAAAIYVVIFTATLLSIIALSFIRLMLSEMGRTSNYSLSQSAYNSALAGIEDAKIVLLRYQNCINNPNYKVNGESINCNELKTYLRDEVDQYSQDCDLVSKALGYNNSNHETIIQTGGNDENDLYNEVKESAATYDQAYTCVKISPKNKNYLTTLTENYPTKIIPIRTEGTEKTDSINRIVISWFSSADLSKIAAANTNPFEINTSDYHSYKGNGDGENLTMDGAIKRNNVFLSDILNYKNNFTAKPIAPSVIQATLIQTASSFKLSQFYSAAKEASTRIGDNGYHTNRGTITLRPTTANPYNIETYDGTNTVTNYSNHIGGDDFSEQGGPFAASAIKSQNTPLDVHCYTEDNVNTANGYACTADIYVPRPITNGSSKTRNYTTFFLVLNLPYGKPQTEVSVELKHCDANSDTIYQEKDPDKDETGCTSVYFDGVQPIVDSTGRANDLFRRVEARVELIDTYFPIVNYALAVNDPEGDDDDVVKDFYVTRGCKYQESTWEDGRVKDTGYIDCNNSGYRK